MTLAELIEKSYVLATGKATAPTTGNKYDKLVALANICQEMWQSEPGVQWDSLYVVTTLPTLVSATDTIPLSTSIREISNRDGDYIKVVRTDGGITEYKLVKPNELADYTDQRVVARIGSNLKFSKAFEADEPEIGGSIKVPNYTYVSTLTDGAQDVQVENPLWLAYAVAAEYCRTDQVLQYREEGLLERANAVMEEMKQTAEANRPAPVKPIVFSHFGRSW